MMEKKCVVSKIQAIGENKSFLVGISFYFIKLKKIFLGNKYAKNKRHNNTHALKWILFLLFVTFKCIS